jgi:outer membrane protein
MHVFHANETVARVDNTPALGVRRWQSSAPLPRAAATAAETYIECGPASVEEANSESDLEIHSRKHMLKKHVPRSSSDPMKSKFLRLVLAMTVVCAVSALAQTGGTAASSTGSKAAGAAPAPAPIQITGTKIGAINIEGAIFGSNEGRKEMEALQKKFEPKQTELKSQNDELEALKKQLQTQGPSLNEDAAANLKSQIETKQKSFDRSVQDAQEDFANQQQEIAGKILQKMAPIIIKYAQENGYGMIIDTSKQWPQGPVLLAGSGVDITPAVVEAFNAQPAAAAPSAPKPAAAKPSASAAKPPASEAKQ